MLREGGFGRNSELKRDFCSTEMLKGTPWRCPMVTLTSLWAHVTTTLDSREFHSSFPYPPQAVLSLPCLSPGCQRHSLSPHPQHSGGCPGRVSSARLGGKGAPLESLSCCPEIRFGGDTCSNIMQKRKTLNELRGKPTHDGKAEGKGGGVSLGQMLKLKISWLFLC